MSATKVAEGSFFQKVKQFLRVFGGNILAFYIDNPFGFELLELPVEYFSCGAYQRGDLFVGKIMNEFELARCFGVDVFDDQPEEALGSTVQRKVQGQLFCLPDLFCDCLLYTSDAADAADE